MQRVDCGLNITFQIMIETHRWWRWQGWSRQESWRRRGRCQSHYRPAWCRAWPGQRSAVGRGRCWRPSWWWSSVSPACLGFRPCSLRSWRRPTWRGVSCRTATGGWRLWTRTSGLSCLVSVPAGWGTSDRWTRWTRLGGGLPSLACHVTSSQTVIVLILCGNNINSLISPSHLLIQR